MGNSGLIAWTMAETRTVYDVTALLNTPAKIDNCEFLILNNTTGNDKLYFDYIYLEVDYIASVPYPYTETFDGAALIRLGSP